MLKKGNITDDKKNNDFFRNPEEIIKKKEKLQTVKKPWFLQESWRNRVFFIESRTDENDENENENGGSNGRQFF